MSSTIVRYCVNGSASPIPSEGQADLENKIEQSLSEDFQNGTKICLEKDLRGGGC